MFVRLLAILAFVCCATWARADALDDTLAKFREDKFPQTAAAVAELAASGSPSAAPILEALGDNRLLIDPVGHILVYRATSGEVINARTGEKLTGVDASGFKKVRVNNPLRSAIAAALGALTLANPEPSKRVAAADAVFKSRELQGVEGRRGGARERDRSPRGRGAATSQGGDFGVGYIRSDRGSRRRHRNPQSPRRRGRPGPHRRGRRQNGLPEIKAAAAAALASIKTRLAIWNVVQNLVYGVSASSVLLLAAIGLAITFGVMGVINMAHGEMVMLGAYATFVVQSLLPPSLYQWSLAIALPLAFLVAGAVGVLIERLIIRYLYGRPLETLLATWGVSLILQQTVRTIFGANNKEVTAPDFMSGSVQWGGLSITAGRLWIVALAILVFVALQFVLRATPFGLRMRAVTQNRRMASSMGISTGRIDMLAFGLGSGIAGIAGVALSQIDTSPPISGRAHHRQLHGRGPRRRRQSLGHAARRAHPRVGEQAARTGDRCGAR